MAKHQVAHSNAQLNPQQLTPFEFGVAVKQDWAPDSRHLLFTKNGVGHPPGISANIATIRPDGTDLKLLTHYDGGHLATSGAQRPGNCRFRSGQDDMELR